MLLNAANEQGVSSFDTFLYSQSALAVVLILGIIMLWREYISEKNKNEALRESLVKSKDETYAKMLELTKSSIESSHEIVTMVKDMVDGMKGSLIGQQQAINDMLEKRTEIMVARISERISTLERFLTENKSR